jgi:hypothetical protein
LLIASRDYMGGKRLMLDAAARTRAAERIARRLCRTPFIEVDAAVSEYVQICARVPDHEWPLDSRSTARTPWPWPLVEYLVSVGYPLRRAWDVDYTQARCLYDAHCEAMGDKSLVSADKQRRIDDWVAREREQKRKLEDVA